MTIQHPTAGQRDAIHWRGIYGILNDSARTEQELLAQAKAALDGGVALLQFRSKSRQPAQTADRAAALLQLCRNASVPLIINDDVALCSDIAADGVHLGKTDMGLTGARRLLGAGSLIGITCHASMVRARDAQAQGADYVAFGRFHPSRTKPSAPAASARLLTVAQAEIAIPIVAIGGINLENGASLIAAGADMLAVSHALFGGDDVYQHTRALTGLFDDDKTTGSIPQTV